jgi:2-polyprenyl-3-methyl-5-hydroxy-6-metoxy-1,4-benzoquinol methylase
MKKALCALLLCIFGMACVSVAQTAGSNDAVWKDFLQWLSAQPPNSKPMDLISPYRNELLKKGVSAAEADRIMDLVLGLAFTRPDGAKVLWNKIFGGNNPIFVQTPTEFLVHAILGRRPGKALDFGMGQGRNSVFLALSGWDVTGFDPSDVGIGIAQENARKAGVKINTVVATDDQFDFGKNRWDLIVVTYVRLLGETDAARLWEALKPGGIVIYENGESSGNKLLRAFLRYRIVQFEDVEATPDWIPSQKGLVERLIAQKPEN